MRCPHDAHLHPEGRSTVPVLPLCRHAQAHGRDNCPTKILPAAEIERFVVERLRALGSSAKFRAEVLAKARAEAATLSAEQIKGSEVVPALEALAARWETLPPQERFRIAHLLIKRVAYDGERETVAITFRSTGIMELAREAQAWT